MLWYLWYCAILQLDVCLKSVFIFRLSSKTSLPEHGGRFRTVLPINLEKQLVEYVEEMSRRFYGLGTKDIRKLCYELAVQNNCDVPETWHVNKSAGSDWLHGFVSRTNSLSLRKPEATSLARAAGFNPTVVENFYCILREILHANEFKPSCIYNIDETGLSPFECLQRKERNKLEESLARKEDKT